MMSPVSEIHRVDSLNGFYNLPIKIDVLRLDLIHPDVSGNKWFKLKEYIREASANDKQTLLTFGGPFSNHIVATAAAASLHNFKSVGVIRGEMPLLLSPSLLDAQRFGMELFFTTRTDYNGKRIPVSVFTSHKEDDLYIIPEGGYGLHGVNGAATILENTETKSYSHIVLAVGTGTTLAGIVRAAGSKQKVIGIPVLKNAFSLQQEIENLLNPGQKYQFTLMRDYHFGGYAKHTNELLQFMNDFYGKAGIPTDFVYTAKAFYAAFDLLKIGYFSATDNVLLIHTGGLQGNRSLKKGTLIFN